MAKIVIADDEQITLMYMQKILQKLDHTVLAGVSSGPAAVEKTRELKPDVVFLDINMPGEYNGLEAGRLIERETGLPVIYITAYSPDDFLELINEAGGFGYLNKPFTEKELNVAISIALYRSRTEKKLSRTLARFKLYLEQERVVSDFLARINKESDAYPKLEELMTPLNSSFELDRMALVECGHDVAQITFIIRSGNPFDLDEDKFVGMMHPGSLNEISVPLLLDPYKLGLTKEKGYIIYIVPVTVHDKNHGFMAYSYHCSRQSKKSLRSVLSIVTHTTASAIERHYDILKIRQLEEEKRLKDKLLSRSERLASMGQMMSGIGHEINQPLQSIKILADSVLFWDSEEKRLPYEQVLDNLRKISDRVNHADEIIKNMKTMIKSPGKIVQDEVDINSIIHRSMEFYSAKLSSHQVRLDLDLDESIPPILASSVQLQQVIVNLVNNALNALEGYDRNDKYIRISTEDNPEEIFISITDNGPGINDTKKEYIFDPFFSENSIHDGMGMGLYIVNTIIESLNSTIEVADNPDEEGVTFLIRLRKGLGENRE